MSTTDRYVVIGNPIEHSKSPTIHALFAAQTRQVISYQTLLAPLDGFAATVRNFMAEGGKGANVTVPFKLDAFELADELSERAKAAGAVNTLSFINGRILGDNTDGVGLVNDITRNAKTPIRDKRVLLLGAGGAARGVIMPLLQESPRELVIANRTVAKAEELVRQFADAGCIRASSFADLDERFDLVINATSASLNAELPPLSPKLFGKDTLAYDMMYAKELTVFLRFAKEHGARFRDGLGMLVEQAAESFLIWRGIRPPATAEVYAALRFGM